MSRPPKLRAPLRSVAFTCKASRGLRNPPTMSKRWQGCLLGAIGLASSAFSGTTSATQLVDANSASQLSSFHTNGCTIESVNTLGGDPSFVLSYGGMWGVWGRRSSFPMDWSAFNGFAFTIENLENRTVQMGVRVDFTSNLSDPSRRQAAAFFLGPRATARVVLELNPQEAWPYRVRGLPGGLTEPHFRLFGTSAVDRTQAYTWLISLNEPTPARMRVGELRLLRSVPSLEGIIDCYGQTADRSWPGKVSSDLALAQQLQAEVQDLNANPGPPDPYGPQAPVGTYSPGRWSVAKMPSGKWFFVSPAGRLFWSFGVTTPTWEFGTPITGREALFASIPPSGNHYVTLRVPYSGTQTGFNFYSANLERKFGPAWQSSFLSHTQKRLRSWGFNTISDWAKRELYAQSSLPFVFGVSTDDFPTRLSTPFRDDRLLPDPFAGDFQGFMSSKLSSSIGAYNGRGEFLGLYVDGELRWSNPNDPATRYQVAVAALNAPMGQPAKASFVTYLKWKYGNTKKLNRAWGTRFASWSSVQSQNCWPSPDLGNAEVLSDIRSFSAAYARNYYSKIKAAMAEIGCTGLYLGARDSFAPPEFLAEADKVVDAHSMGYYNHPEKMDWSFSWATKPILLYEFSFGASDRGAWHPGPVSTLSQADRASRMSAYLWTALANPMVVGAHWFQYVDQHPSGRNDGENYNVGFVSITDTPFPEMVAASRSLGRSLYSLRAP
jgi:hypothetical protein